MIRNLASAVRMLFALRCDESSRLLSDQFESPLSRTERWAVRLHQISCRQCRRLARQLRLLEDSLKLRSEQPARLSDSARDRIAQCLCDADHGH